MKRFPIVARRLTLPLALSLCLPICRLARADEPVASGTSGTNDAGASAATVFRLTNEGTTLFQGGDYRHALERFLQAAAIDQDSNLLFNIARCYEMLGDRDAAIEKYEAFLAKPDADTQGKRRASDAIRTLREAKAGSAAATHSGAAMTQSAAPAGSDRPLDAQAGGVPARDDGRKSFFVAAMITLGAGVLVTASGVIAYALGASDHSKVTNSAGYGNPTMADPLTEAQAQKLVDSGNTKELIGGIAMGVGAALLATSVVLFVVRPSGSGEKTGAYALHLAPSPSGGQFLFEGRF
jgi:hypothetical protein